MTTEIKYQIKKIKNLCTAYKLLKSVEDTEDAQKDLEEKIVEEARCLAELFTEEELEKCPDSVFTDLKLFSKVAKIVTWTCYKTDYAMAQKHRAVMAAVDEMILAIATEIADED